MPSLELADHRRPDESKNPSHVIGQQQVQRPPQRPRPHYGTLLHSSPFNIALGHPLRTHSHGQDLGNCVLRLYRRYVTHNIIHANCGQRVQVLRA